MFQKGKKGSFKIFNRRAVFWLISFLLPFLLVGLMGITLKFFKDYQNLPSQHLIGNWVSNVKALEEKGLPFSFLVIGDTQSQEVAETLMKLALNQGRYSFMIIVGDYVKKPDIWSHRFFLTEMTTEMKLPFPVFLVAGNHDIDYTASKIKEKERRVTPEVFDTLYGARDLDFVFNQCLFILCEIDPRNPTGYLSYLRDGLSKKGEGRKYTFVFIHFPPKGLGAPENFLPNEEEFFSLLESYRVTTCFFGHYHGYRRGQRKGINLVVVGGGGGRLKSWQSEWGKFHHILRVSVDNDKISEDLITIRETFSFEDSFEEWIFTHLFPILKDRVWLLYVSFILFLSLGIYSLIFFIIKLKKGERRVSRRT